MRACRSKDVKRRAPRGRERESPLAPLFVCFLLPPGPVLCKLGLGRSALLPEVLTRVLGCSFDLPLLYFCWLFPSCPLAAAIVDSFSLLYLTTACMHAKSLQLCLILCDPMNHSPPGSSDHGISQARILEWKKKKKNTGVGWHALLQGIFPTQGSNLCLLHWSGDSSQSL